MLTVIYLIVFVISAYKETQILAIGNCDGRLYFYEIINTKTESSARKVDEMCLDSSLMIESSKTVKIQENERK